MSAPLLRANLPCVAQNGHRFVFHCDEVRAVQRRYIPGDPGILNLAQSPTLCGSASSSAGSNTPDHTMQSDQPDNSRIRQSTGLSEKDTSMQEDDSFGLTEDSILAPSGSNLQSNPRASPAAAQQPPRRQVSRPPKQVLTAGAAIYWHYLVPGGERPAPRGQPSFFFRFRYPAPDLCRRLFRSCACATCPSQVWKMSAKRCLLCQHSVPLLFSSSRTISTISFIRPRFQPHFNVLPSDTRLSSSSIPSATFTLFT